MKVLQFASAMSILIFSSSSVSDPCVEIGKPLPLVAFKGESHAGEVIYSNGDIQYADWTSEQLEGKVFVVYYLAARMGIDEVNGEFLERLDRLGLSPESYQMVTILNIDDVFFGGRGFARDTFEENKKAHREATLVIDDDSVIRTAWCLKNESSTIAVVDSKGRVVNFRDGKLDDDELQEFYTSVQALSGATEMASPPTR